MEKIITSLKTHDFLVIHNIKLDHMINYGII